MRNKVSTKFSGKIWDLHSYLIIIGDVLVGIKYKTDWTASIAWALVLPDRLIYVDNYNADIYILRENIMWINYFISL